MTTNEKFRYMDGSTSAKSYLAFARRGDVLLGIKPNVIIPGEQVDVPDTVYIGARVRSAPKPGGWDGLDDSGDGVVQHLDIGLDKVWPDITFTNTDKTRASTHVHIRLRGNPEKHLGMLTAALDTDMLPTKFAEFLTMLAGGEDYLIISPDDLKEWCEKHYRPRFEKIEKAIAYKAEHKVLVDKAKEDAAKHVGEFGIQAVELKALYDLNEKYKDAGGEGPMDVQTAGVVTLHPSKGVDTTADD